MRDYAKVSPRFWTGETGKEIRKLGAETQVVAFYLFTCPMANMLGLYYINLPNLCHETGRDFEGARKALRSLSEVGFAHFDEHSECVYLPNMAREQIGERLTKPDNRHKAVVKELEQLRKTPFFNDFVERYRDSYELHDVVLNDKITSPLKAPSKPLRSQEQDQEQDQEQKQDQEQEGDARGNKPKASKLPKAPKPPPRKRCPDDFVITDEMRSWAKANAPDVPLDRETDKFKDHEFQKARSDWPATWRNWMRTAQESLGQFVRGPKQADAFTAQRLERDRLNKLMERRAALGKAHGFSMSDFRDPYPNETADQYSKAQDDEFQKRLHAPRSNVASLAGGALKVVS